MPNPNERPPGFGFPVDRFDSRTLADILSGKPKPPKLHLRDMTPAQIHAAYGDEIASYIVELRSNVGVWKRIATDRIRSTPVTVSAGEVTK